MSVELPRLLDALRESWSADTCQLFREEWDPSNPARGQCCTTALVIQHYYDGWILRGFTNKWTIHYWNELPDGTWLDATHSQFEDDEYIMNWAQRYPDTLWRFNETLTKYERLLGRVESLLSREDVTA